MRNEPKIRFVQKKDLLQLVNLCKLHADYEKADYDVHKKKNY